MGEIDSVCRKVREYLGMGFSPVGVKLLCREDPANASYDKVERPESFCWYVHEAAKGKNFLMRHKELACGKAQIVLGFREPRFSNIEPRIKDKTFAIGIGPVADADVVMLVLNPEQAMTLSHLLGGIHISFKRNRTVCGEGLAHVYQTKQPAMSLLCIGARMDGEFGPDELLVTFPYKDFIALPAKMTRFASLSRLAVDTLKSRFGKLHLAGVRSSPGGED